MPGYKVFKFKHLASNYNGTLACDGQLMSGVKKITNPQNSGLSLSSILEGQQNDISLPLG